MWSVVEEHTRSRTWLQAWLDEDFPVLQDMHVNVASFVRFVADRGGARMYDFMQMLHMSAWGIAPNAEFRHILHARQLLDDDDTESACVARAVMDTTVGDLGRDALVALDRKMPTYRHVLFAEPSPSGAEHEHALAQYVMGAPARLVMAAIRRMATAFLCDDCLPVDRVVACLYPVFTTSPTVRHLMCAVNSGGVGEFLTFADVLGMVGLCRDVSHLRVFKFLPSMVFRCGGTSMKMAAAKTWTSELEKPEKDRRRGEIVPHVITKEEAGDTRLLEILPAFHLPQPRFGVTIHGLHGTMYSGVAAAMVGDGCRHVSLVGTTVSRAYTFLMSGMQSTYGEATVRSRAVLTLKLSLTVKDTNEGYGDRKALLLGVMRMFPCLKTLDVCGPSKKLRDVDSEDSELAKILASTAPDYTKSHHPVYDSLEILRWDLAEVDNDFFLQFLTGFRRLKQCSIGENATLWIERRSRIVRAMAMKSAQHLVTLNVSGHLSCKLPHIESLVMLVESTSDVVLPAIEASTMLTIEAHEGEQSDLTELKRTHPRLAVRVYKCTGMDVFPDRSGRKRPRAPGMYDYLRVVSADTRKQKR